MAQNKYKTLLLLFIAAVELLACVPPNTQPITTQEQITPSTTPVADVCLPPIESFIYSSEPNDEKPVPGETLIVEPPSPWESVAELPPSKIFIWSITTSRMINGNIELWISHETGNGFETEFLVFQTDTKVWKTVSSKIEGGQVSVGKLFTTSDGSLWGAADYFSNGTTLGLGQGEPALSKYNESKEKFEFVSSASEILAREDIELRIPSWSIVLKDSNDIFWVLVPNDAIYSFDPKTNLVEKYSDLQGKEIYDAVISPKGDIYYVLDVDTYGKMSIGQTPLLRFDPSTGKSEYLQIEFWERWPLYGKPFVDLEGRLWLGNLGFFDGNKTWYLFEKSNVFLTNRTEQSVDTRWKVATPLLQSSDGRMWFRSSNGTVWLDLEKQKWCWFTTYQSNIVEDSEHNLWMIADNKLYKLPLGEQ